MKIDHKTGVSPDLVFGLDTQLFSVDYNKTHALNEMVFDPSHQENEVDLIQVVRESSEPQGMSKEDLEAFLKTMPKEDIYRVKGFLRLDDGLYILNHAFGRFELTRVEHAETLAEARNIEIKVTVMGQDLRMYKDRVQQGLLKGREGQVTLTAAHRH